MACRLDVQVTIRWFCLPPARGVSGVRRVTLSQPSSSPDQASSNQAAAKSSGNSAPPPSRARRFTDKPSEESLKETFESVIIAFILAFVFRAYIVEAFVIPTGSMAPTLMGEHMHVTCQECGYRFDTDSQSRPREQRGNQRVALNTHLICPMCHFPNPLSSQTASAGGDRILVHKFVYNLVEPSRWDVVVFKEPANPSENFIKRLVGLPDEKVWIIEGNIYVKSNTPGSDWRIARKSEARLGYKTQRDLWQPLYHSQYVPMDQGVISRERQVENLNFAWQTPWDATNPASWKMAGLRSYEHLQAGEGSLKFNFNQAMDPIQTTWYPYNQFHRNGVAPGDPPVVPAEDIRVAASFEAKATGLGVTLSTQARLGLTRDPAGVSTLKAHINPEGQAWLEAVGPADAQGNAKTFKLTEKINVGPFMPALARNVELWYCDQEASLWVAGRQVAIKQFDIPMDAIIKRPALERLPLIQIDVQGPAVTLHQVDVDRDIHYTSTLVNSSIPGLGAMTKTLDGPRGQPVTLSKDQFFCMGDNSPLSSDGRFWNDVNPWIERRMLEGDVQKVGVVPRKLMMGRAFFVYFPAMYPWKPGSAAMIPNFGKLRFIH